MLSDAVRRKAWGKREALIEVGELQHFDEQIFRAEYVDKFKPVVIRGMAKNWSSRIKLEEIAAQAGEQKIKGVITEPVPESAEDYVERVTKREMPLVEFMRRLSSGDEFVQAYAIDCVGPFASIAPTAEERAELPLLLQKPSRAARVIRTFIAARGFTDWHRHDADETLTFQLLGTKELLFIGPAQEEQLEDIVVESAQRNEIVGVNNNALDRLSIYRATLLPGDVVYIPVYWSHLARSDDVSVTVAMTFETPLHIAADLRLFGARNVVKLVFKRKKWKFIPLLMLAIPYALGRNILMGFDPRAATPA